MFTPRCLYLAGALLVICSLILVLTIPWQAVVDGMTLPLGYAPLWSSRFATVPGVHIDWWFFGTYLAFAVLVSVATGLLIDKVIPLIDHPSETRKNTNT
jgi:hypothetical protein